MSTKQVEDDGYLTIGDPYLKLRQTIETDLANTGFEPDEKPEGREPRIRDKLSGKTTKELCDLYDEFLHFYDYLCDLITSIEPSLITADERTAVTRAALVKKVARMDLSNAEQRNAWIETHPDFIVIKQDSLYFKQLLKAQTSRRERIMKSMQRVYREIAYRTSVESGKNAYANPDRASKAKRGFKRIGAKRHH